MNSTIALFFASLVSGMLSLADFRPAFSDVVQILTGVALDKEPKETAVAKTLPLHSTLSEQSKADLGSDTEQVCTRADAKKS